jgi:phage gpG-like protein
MDAIDTLENLSKALQNPAKLGTVGAMAVEAIRGHIYQGQGWSPLAPATAAYRETGRPLQDTGALRDSITFNVLDDRTVSVGTGKSYAALQNNGGVIRAKKNWLWIPGPGLRKIQRKKGSGFSVTDVLNYHKNKGDSIYRRGRTVRYRKKRKHKGEEDPVLFYLKKSVEIPARPFFYLSAEETALIMEEAGIDLEQL